MIDKATDRRNFLKSGALVAAPLAAVAMPAAALADDGARVWLARREDERAIEALHRAFLRQFNGGGECGQFVARAGAVTLEQGLRWIADDPAHDGTLELDGIRATSRRSVRVEFDTAFAGHSTLEQMARFQGHGSHRHTEARVLAADYIKDSGSWRIARLRLV